MNLASYLLSGGSPEDLAIKDGAHWHTFADLAYAVDCIARQLQESGVESGSRVALLSRNSFFWIAVYLGTLKLGAVCVPIPLQTARDNLDDLLSWTCCSWLCLERDSAVREDAVPPRITLLREEQFQRANASAGPRDPVPFAAVQPGTLATLMLTSGSTRRPRAVMVTHGNIIANTKAIIECLALSATERILCSLPLSYCFGASLLHTHLAVGGSLVLSTAMFQPQLALRQMLEESCTGFAGVPSIFQVLLRHGASRRLAFPSGIRKVQQAGGRLAANFVLELQQAWPSAEIFLMYGQTEATARLTCLPPQDLLRKAGSVGLPVRGVTIDLLRADGTSAPAGEVGEIHVSGESVTSGYWSEKDLTGEVFVSGCLKTGDLAYRDAEGYLFLVGRMQDFIKSCGVRISVRELEDCLMTLPDIIEVAAVPMPDHLRGEAMHLAVVCSADSTLTAARLLQYCREHVSNSLLPRDVVFFPELPKTSSGKINRAALCATIAERRAFDVSQSSRGLEEQGNPTESTVVGAPQP